MHTEVDRVVALAQENSKHIAQLLTSLEYVRDMVTSVTEVQKIQGEKIAQLSAGQEKSGIANSVVFGAVQLILMGVVSAILYLVIK